jgi:hypothetical protein
MWGMFAPPEPPHPAEHTVGDEVFVTSRLRDDNNQAGSPTWSSAALRGNWNQRALRDRH